MFSHVVRCDAVAIQADVTSEADVHALIEQTLLDFGRIDVLTEIAVDAGLERTEAKAVLDVDKYSADLAAVRTDALESGIDRIPTIRVGSESLVGPAGIHDLRFLFESPGGATTGT